MFHNLAHFHRIKGVIVCYNTVPKYEKDKNDDENEKKIVFIITITNFLEKIVFSYFTYKCEKNPTFLTSL